MERRPMMRTTVGWLVALTLALVSPSVWADTIRFTNGTRMRGTVLKRTSTEILVKLSFGTVSFLPAEIVSIEPEAVSDDAADAADASTAAPTLPAAVRAPNVTTPLVPSAGAPSSTPDEAPQPPAGATAAATLPDAMQAVVFIGTLFDDGSMGIGSGAVINNKGVVVTNYHVVEHAKDIKVILPSSNATISLASARPYEARVLKADPCYDLAVLRVPVSTPHYLRFADDDAIHVGEEVRAVGNPEGLTVSVSKGVISAVRSMKELGLEDILGKAATASTACGHLSGRQLGAYTLVQTDASINPGNSGGPLLNAQNEIVGINTLMVGHGLNFSIHVKHARTIVGSYVKE